MKVPESVCDFKHIERSAIKINGVYTASSGTVLS